MNVIVPKRRRKSKTTPHAARLPETRGAVSPAQRRGKQRLRRMISAAASRLAERREARGDAERQLDRHADVELRVGPAAHQVLVQEVLEMEAPDERVTLDAPVREIAARNARALAVLQRADAARVERAAVKRRRELWAHGVERQEPVLVARERGLDEDADDRPDLRAALPAAVFDRQQTARDGRPAR